MKEPILYLCHRIPFPPNKGDKITTYNILKFLNKHYDLYLGCFIDDPNDIQYKENVDEMCKESFFIELNPQFSKIKGLTAFGKGEPITLPYYRSRKMFDWVNQTIEKNNISKAFIYSACMAQYVLTSKTSHLYKVIQFADIDSDKWRQYAQNSDGIMSKIYMREYHKLGDYEKYIAKQFAISCFISDSEAASFQQLLDDETQIKIKTLSNGIDSEYFSPEKEAKLSESFSIKYDNYILFTGAMDYRPNIETVIWFTQQIWPKIIRRCPRSKFYIVGSSPPKKVQELEKCHGVVVTGRVEDIRPYFSHAKAAIAPMLMGRGIQNKILEAMSMALPVLTSKLGIEGLEDCPTDNLFVTDNEKDMINWICDKLDSPSFIANDARDWLEQHYSWNAKLSPLLNYLGDECE